MHDRKIPSLLSLDRFCRVVKMFFSSLIRRTMFFKSPVNLGSTFVRLRRTSWCKVSKFILFIPRVLRIVPCLPSLLPVEFGKRLIFLSVDNSRENSSHQENDYMKSYTFGVTIADSCL